MTAYQGFEGQHTPEKCQMHVSKLTVRDVNIEETLLIEFHTKKRLHFYITTKRGDF
jgi:hypothetical protein